MSRRIAASLLGCAASVLGCGGHGVQAPLAPAGQLDSDDTGKAVDDGSGQLARASVQFLTGPAGEPDAGFTEPARYEPPTYNEFGGFEYGGAGYGAGLGGASYANYYPNVSNMPANRPLGYEVRPLGDAGAVAGTVAWSRAPADRRLASPCGEIDNPTLRIGARDEAGGAVVYLDEIKQGRPLAMGIKPLALGGTIERTPCAMRPAVQVLSPAPSPVTVYADATRETMTVSAMTAAGARAAGDPTSVELAPGGFTQVAVGIGVTSIGDAGGRAVPGWIIAPGHPYVAMTDDLGRFQIGDVVPGTYKLVVWHPPVVTGWRDGKPVYGAPVVVTRTVKVAPYTTAKLDVALN